MLDYSYITYVVLYCMMLYDAIVSYSFLSGGRRGTFGVGKYISIDEMFITIIQNHNTNTNA